jgi:hypothetical protein
MPLLSPFLRADTGNPSNFKKVELELRLRPYFFVLRNRHRFNTSTQLCAGGGRKLVEDMCYEIRRAAAYVS